MIEFAGQMAFSVFVRLPSRNCWSTARSGLIVGEDGRAQFRADRWTKSYLLTSLSSSWDLFVAVKSFMRLQNICEIHYSIFFLFYFCFILFIYFIFLACNYLFSIKGPLDKYILFSSWIHIRVYFFLLFLNAWIIFDGIIPEV